MRLGIVVTEFPKTTETFILRDIMEFSRNGHELRVYHMSPFRKKEVLHEFARPILQWTRSFPFLLGRKPFGALMRAVFLHPVKFFTILGQILWGFRTSPVYLAKSIAFLPKFLACAEDLKEWGAEHVHGEFATHPGTCCWIAGRMTGLPYSVSCRAHDIFITQAMLDRKLGEAAFIRTISEFNVKFLKERVPALAGRDMAVIHSSLHIERIVPETYPPAGPFTVLYVGSLEFRKGINFLLEALHEAGPELGDWRAIVIGEGPEHARMEALSARLGLTERVGFIGAQSHESVARHYAGAHVVVTPSIIGPGGRTEGIPNVVIETLAHERPSITTRVSGIPELVENGVTGYLVEPEDSGAIAAALRDIHRDPAAAHALARNGRRRVEAEFDIVKNAKRQLELFAAHSTNRQG